MPDRAEFSVVGVDLAAQPEKTAYCVIRVDEANVCVEDLKLGAKDDCLLDVFCNANVKRIGIDAPFGWPVGFADAVSEHRILNRWPLHDANVYAGPKCNSKEEYRDLKYRATDLHIWERAKKKPLSVAVDSLGAVAMRCATLLSQAESRWHLEVDRSGRTGHFVEVYPAAAFKRWAVNRTLLRQKVRNLGLDVSDEVADRLAKSEHAVDALAASLVALMVEIDPKPDPKPDQGFIEPIPPEKVEVAKREGWIALPKTCSLTRLRHWLSERRRPAR